MATGVYFCYNLPSPYTLYFHLLIAPQTFVEIAVTLYHSANLIFSPETILPK